MLTNLREVQLNELKELTKNIQVSNSLNSKTSHSILNHLTSTFWENAPNKQLKWRDRVAVIESELVPVLVPGITVNENLTELVKLIKDLILDPQIPLSLLGIKIVKLICLSIGSKFKPYAKVIHPPRH